MIQEEGRVREIIIYVCKPLLCNIIFLETQRSKPSTHCCEKKNTEVKMRIYG